MHWSVSLATHHHFCLQQETLVDPHLLLVWFQVALLTKNQKMMRKTHNVQNTKDSNRGTDSSGWKPDMALFLHFSMSLDVYSSGQV